MNSINKRINCKNHSPQVIGAIGKRGLWCSATVDRSGNSIIRFQNI